jgi:hypothetical protein
VGGRFCRQGQRQPSQAITFRMIQSFGDLLLVVFLIMGKKGGGGGMILLGGGGLRAPSSLLRIVHWLSQRGEGILCSTPFSSFTLLYAT